MTELLARLWIALIGATHDWSQGARTRLGRSLGGLLWLAARARRRIALANLRACFPQWSEARRRAVARACFDCVARGIVDHAVLARGTREQIEGYVRVEGVEHLLDRANRPVIAIAPHFVGLDAGGVRMNCVVRGVSIYARQSNRVWDDWLLAIRNRFSAPLLLARGADLRQAVRAMKEGLPFYYLPDMDNGPVNSIFVPFFGVPAATLPMVSRLARMSGAKVVMAVTEMTPDGYVLHFESPWADFPSDSVEADTARVNAAIERWVLRMPEQYLWTHKRFKTRPPGARTIY
jgi:Kdo2-lipid IVA lauroyltransferase/acyltransferase